MDRHELLQGRPSRRWAPTRATLNFNAYADQRSRFRYAMHTLPSEMSSSIGTSTLLAAWNAAIYVAQIEDERLEAVMSDGAIPRGHARRAAAARRPLVPE